MIQPRRRAESGVLCLAAALGVSILASLLPYFWASVLQLTVPSSAASLAYAVHVFLIPLSGLALQATVAALAVVGYLLIRRNVYGVEPTEMSKLNFAGLALLLAVACFIVYTFAGVLLGIGRFPGMQNVHRVAYLIGTIGVGFFLYWTLVGIGPRNARFAGIAALVLGVTGILLIYGPRVALTQFDSAGLEVVGAVLGFISLAIWFGAYVWGFESVRLRRTSQPPATPAT